MEQIFPGVSAAYNGLAWYHAGLLDPNLGGAWSQYAIGQYTQFSGIEPLQQGKIHFAGEGTSMELQGFMEGAVTTGERVANEIHAAP
jgi:monoamine oxidase